MLMVEGCTVWDYLETYPQITDRDKLILCQNIVAALSELHKKGIIFTDISPSNMMVNPKTLKVTFIDYGKSVLIPKHLESIHNPSIPMWYSLGYNVHVPPEINHERGKVSFASDIWILGYRVFKNMQFESLNLNALIAKMLHDEPQHRISLAELANDLEQFESEFQYSSGAGS